MKSLVIYPINVRLLETKHIFKYNLSDHTQTTFWPDKSKLEYIQRNLNVFHGDFFCVLLDNYVKMEGRKCTVYM
jgi:UDP-2,3-diacylglucosamine pyrophosphatase LpxH